MQYHELKTIVYFQISLKFLYQRSHITTCLFFLFLSLAILIQYNSEKFEKGYYQPYVL